MHAITDTLPRALQLLAPLEEPTPGDVVSARERACLSQAEAAHLVGLGAAVRWSEYERGARVPDPARWALFLLATGQHPHAVATPRRGKAAPT
jgi:DNA-binding transcriptional regulator YiaG